MSNKKLSKKERSNALRLAALQDKKQSQHPVLKIPAEVSKYPQSSQHIVFTERESESENIQEKITLFDDSASEENDEEIFGERFHGPGGEKLLQLQRRIGVDQRFRLDDKFLDNESLAPCPSEEATKKETEDEKNRSLAVLNSILGPSTISTTSRVDVVIPPRYDPLSSTATLHEQPVEALNNKEVTSNEDEKMGNSPDNELPVVSNDTYYTINTDLHGLFTADSEESKFNFLSSESDCEMECAVEEKVGVADKEQRPIKVENEPMEVKQEERMFFYHSNTVVEHSFYRTEPLHTLEEGWPDKRMALKQAFRKRHKEAAKTVTKIRKHVT